MGVEVITNWGTDRQCVLDLKSKVHEDRSYQILQVNERYEGLEFTWFMVEFTITGTDEDDQERGWRLADQTEMHYAALVEAQKAVEAMENLHTYWEDFRPTLIGTEEECEAAHRKHLYSTVRTTAYLLNSCGLIDLAEQVAQAADEIGSGCLEPNPDNFFDASFDDHTDDDDEDDGFEAIP